MNQYKHVICINCGKQGHIFKRCRDPVISLGIIIYKFDKAPEGNKLKIIMIQRRNSLCFVELIRGKYNVDNKKYIQLLFDEMTDDEIIMLQSTSFKDIWDYLWINNNKDYKSDYIMALKKYQTLDIGEFVKNKNLFYDSPEWGFPKGRRNFKEKDIECAIRECCEETGLPKSYFSIIKNIVPIREEFVGNNNVRYRHTYYIAKIKDLYKDIELSIDMNSPQQYAEIGDLNWLTKEECLEKIRSSDIRKKQIIDNVFSFLENNQSLYLDLDL